MALRMAEDLKGRKLRKAGKKGKALLKNHIIFNAIKSCRKSVHEVFEITNKCILTILLLHSTAPTCFDIRASSSLLLLLSSSGSFSVPAELL
jgi:hypothetical protein